VSGVEGFHRNLARLGQILVHHDEIERAAGVLVPRDVEVLAGDFGELGIGNRFEFQEQVGVAGDCSNANRDGQVHRDPPRRE